MAHRNTSSRYGSVAKSFHWLTALLILSLIPLGLVAQDHADAIRAGETGEALIARTAFLFSLHKTLGLAVFFTALARIAWSLAQPKPGLLNGDRPVESWAAETVHWLLYGSLVAVPLSGWVHHAATSGFAPIWWPFGQTLPFVPQSETLAQLTGTLHYLLQWVLVGAIVLHVAGALKHHVIDRDATLRRMLPGQGEANPTARQPGHALPLVSAALIWAAVMGGAAANGWFAASGGSAEAAVPAPSQATATGGNWQVTDGTLGLTVVQMGSEVSGKFADWSAEIAYAETPGDSGFHGRVNVDIRISSLTLGSVTDQALGAEYLAAETHPRARFEADLISEGGQHIARGTLTIRDHSVPVDMPFTLTIEGDTARAAGGLEVDRRDFGIGPQQEGGSLAAAVRIEFDLTATRAGGT